MPSTAHSLPANYLLDIAHVLVSKAISPMLLVQVNGIIAYVNTAAAKALQLPDSDLLNTHIDAYTAPQYPWTQLLQQTQAVTYSYTLNTNTHHFYLHPPQLVDAAHGMYLLQLEHNPIPTLRPQKEILENRQLKLLIDLLPDTIYIKDIEGRKVVANKTDYTNIGANSEQEVLGKTDLELFDGEAGRRGYEVDQHVLQSGESVINKEELFIGKDGSQRWILTTKVPIKNKAGVITGLVGIGRNITKRKETEAAQAQSEKNFQTIFHTLPIPLVLTHASDGTIEMANNAMQQLLGFDAQQLIGQKTAPLYVKASDRNKIAREMQLHNNVANIEIQLKNAHGQVVTCLTSVENIVLNNRPMYLKGFVDIGERKRIEEALHKSESNLKTVFDNTNIGYALLDKKLRVLSFNMAMQQFAQNDLHANIAIGAYALDYFSEERKKAVGPALEQALLGQSVSYEVTYLQPDKTNRWYKMKIFPVPGKHTKVGGVILSLEDITEQKNTELALQTSIQQISDYKLALNESSIVAITDAKGIIKYANNNFCTISKYTSNELIGKSHRIVNSGYHSKAFFQQMWQTIASGSIWKGEFKNKAKDGTYYWVDSTIVPFLDSQGVPYQYMSIRKDITERKSAELELQKSFEILTEQNKRLKDFSYIVSHNLRSHTSNIKSITHFLEIMEDEAEQREMVRNLKTVVELLDETLYNLNEVVAIQKNININVEPLLLYQYINKVLDVLANKIADKCVQIINNIHKEVVVYFNPAYLESVLLNFVSNAIKYSHPERTPVIAFNCTVEFNQLVLLISDNGLGMDLSKNKDKLFGMYKTFHGNSDARGIGLFITKNQLDALGAKVEVESEVNVGTIFKIYFK